MAQVSLKCQRDNTVVLWEPRREDLECVICKRNSKV